MDSAFRADGKPVGNYLNRTPGWQKILGIKKADKNQKDVEIILRLFSLFEQWDSYEKPMLRYLNTQMDANREFSSDRAERFKARFPIVVDIVNQALDKPFRPKGVINAAVLEAVLVTLLENEAVSPNTLRNRYRGLLDDVFFADYVSRATTDTQVLQSRLTAARKILTDGAI